MNKRTDIELKSLYEGEMYKDLPLTLHFLKSMTPQADAAENSKNEVEEKEKKEKSTKAEECTFQKTKMYICHEFYKPISKPIHPPKNESEIDK